MSRVRRLVEAGSRVDGGRDSVQIVAGQLVQRVELDGAVGRLPPGTVGDEEVKMDVQHQQLTMRHR